MIRLPMWAIVSLAIHSLLVSSQIALAQADAESPFELVVSGHPQPEYIGGYQKLFEYVNDYPAYRRQVADANGQPRYLYIYLHDAGQRKWALQDVAPDPKRNQANATGTGDRPWSATWTPAGIRITPVFAKVIKGNITEKDKRPRYYTVSHSDLPLSPNIHYIIELYSKTIDAVVIVQDPRGGAVATTEPVQGKGQLKARFEGRLSGTGRRLEIRSTGPGEYLLSVRMQPNPKAP